MPCNNLALYSLPVEAPLKIHDSCYPFNTSGVPLIVENDVLTQNSASCCKYSANRWQLPMRAFHGQACCPRRLPPQSAGAIFGSIPRARLSILQIALAILTQRLTHDAQNFFLLRLVEALFNLLDNRIELIAICGPEIQQHQHFRARQVELVQLLHAALQRVGIVCFLVLGNGRGWLRGQIGS